ncbi:TFIIB-type zinc ribbon-containing protein [Methanocaldococcus sp.]|uniref:TFIIB-type zinc ribbon-containing protein n=1 Tax=Methanocaldococcus sp. TaxID=2152917 RepID=UPI00261547DE|nr:TFIIB-type zinc ribbon-containing protein [Methanocaldococcus sp.]MCQ6254761.1 hypothetical protein [Methanocaldococcus sp.]
MFNLECHLCGGSNFIFDERRDELYCSMCGYVVESIAVVLEVKYDMMGLQNIAGKIRHYERNRRYKRKKGREKMLKKFQQLCLKYGKRDAIAYFDRFIMQYNQRGLPNNIISRDMEKLFLEFFKVKEVF